MRKHFITHISQQGAGNLRKPVYDPVGNSRLAYGYPCSFPIVPAIAGYVEDGESFVLTVIRATGDSNDKNNEIQANYEALLGDIEAIKQNKGIDFTFEERPVYTSYESTSETLEKLSRDIVDNVRVGEEVYACITFGEKPDTLATYRALMEIHTDHRIEDDIRIELCMYGQYRFGEGRGKVKDVTSFLMRGVEPRLPSEPLKEIEELLSETGPAEALDDGRRRKHFITTISLTKAFQPNQYYYETDDKEFYKPVRYPIIPVIAEAVQPGDRIVVSTVEFSGIDDDDLQETMGRNRSFLQEELEGIKVHTGIAFEYELNTIKTPYNATNSTLNDLCNALEGAIADHEELYACLTFGEKPDTIAIQQALSEVVATRAWLVSIIACVYGRRSWVEDIPSRIIDVTRFVTNNATELVLRRHNEQNTTALRHLTRLTDDQGEDTNG